jgi:6-pyruvoyltetrahydropterin/6-carboxytetrahydropterin synthase
VSLARRYRFSAAHRLHNPALDAERNLALYRECGRDHGHNYVFWVRVEGPLDAATGQLVPLEVLDRLVRERVLERMDHHFLSGEQVGAPGPGPWLSTAENLARLIHDHLAPVLPPGLRLAEVRLYETESNSVEFPGDAALPGA